MPGPLSATLTSTLSSRSGRPSVTRAPAAQNLNALSTRLATARSISSTSTAPPPATRRVARRSHTPWRAARSVNRKAMSASSSFRSTTSGRIWNSGSSSIARSPIDCTSRAALRVLRRAISARRRSSVRAASPAQRVERLQAGGGGGQRRAQVVRQVADRLAAEMIEAAQRVPLPAQGRKHRVEGERQLAELVPGRRRQRAAGRDRQPLGESALGQRRHRLRELAQRPCHRGDDEDGEQRRQRDDGRARHPAPAARSCCAARPSVPRGTLACAARGRDSPPRPSRHRHRHVAPAWRR